jgi:hypothetical protein
MSLSASPFNAKRLISVCALGALATACIATPESPTGETEEAVSVSQTNVTPTRGTAHPAKGRQPAQPQRLVPSLAASTSTSTSTSTHCGRPTGTPPLRQHGGSIIPNANVTNVYWGSVIDTSDLDTFMTWVSASFYVAHLSEYGHIGAGSFGGSIPWTAAPRRVGQSDVENLIDDLVANGQLPENTSGNEVYAIYLPKGTTAWTGDIGTSMPSCPKTDANGECFCGYHSWYDAGGIFGLFGTERHYFVIPDLTDAPGWCGGPGHDLGDRTVASSHELAETITDPHGDAWHSNDTAGDEIGDLCNGYNVHPNIFRNANTLNYWVQCEYSNSQRTCVNNL